MRGKFYIPVHRGKYQGSGYFVGGRVSYLFGSGDSDGSVGTNADVFEYHINFCDRIYRIRCRVNYILKDAYMDEM